jgi:hypothetical protein
MDNDEDDSDEFTYLFDGQNIDDWRMAGPGEFVLVEYDNHCDLKEEWHYYDILRYTNILEYL